MQVEPKDKKDAKETDTKDTRASLDLGDKLNSKEREDIKSKRDGLGIRKS